jgi:hypothetical protein
MRIAEMKRYGYFIILSALISVGVTCKVLAIQVGPPETTTCDAIQSMINNLPASGGEIDFQEGTYRCSQPLIIDRNGVFLRGQGAATVLQIADNANAPVLVIGQTTPIPDMTRRNIRVSSLTIDGNRYNQHGEECWGGACTSAAPIRNNGITLRRVEDVHIDHVTVVRARSGGLVSELGTRRLTVRDFAASDSQFDGLAGYQTRESSYSGIEVHNNLGAGLSFDIAFNSNSLSDITIADNQSVGIFIRDSHNNIFNNLVIVRNGDHGIFVAQVDADPTKAATNNIFQGLKITRSAGAGVRVNDASCIENIVAIAQIAANDGGCISEVTPGLVHQNQVICH